MTDIYFKTDMDFPQAMSHLIAGGRVAKAEWGDLEYYAELRNGLLMLHKPEGWFSWTVSEADMIGTDWMALTK